MTNHYGDGNPAHCCLPGAWDWYSNGINARLYSEPLPDRVITAASAANVDPHRLWDELEADGWEGHDSGLAEEAVDRAAILRIEGGAMT